MPDEQKRIADLEAKVHYLTQIVAALCRQANYPVEYGPLGLWSKGMAELARSAPQARAAQPSGSID